MTEYLNTYQTKFPVQCPNNGCWVEYNLTISGLAVVKVEKLLDYVHSIRTGFHEPIADHLHKMFGGRQVITAFHHGVTIETVRGPHTGRTDAPIESGAQQ